MHNCLLCGVELPSGRVMIWKWHELAGMKWHELVGMICSSHTLVDVILGKPRVDGNEEFDVRVELVDVDAGE